MLTFEELGLKPDILKAILEIGFVEPTAIQQKTIPHLLNTKQDLIALAQTGSGKTAAFGLPVINQIDSESKKTQSLVLCPTRELAIQIANDFNSYTKYSKKLDVVPVYGGASIETQIKSLNKGAQIVVGTPGRVVDLIKRKKLKLEDIEWVVLDEADEMLNMGFKDDLDFILSHTPDQRQTLLFSATMSKEVLRISNNYMNNPEEISSGKRNQGADKVEHFYFVVNGRDKYLALKRIADINPDIYAIIFCRTKRETQEISDQLMADGYNADCLHGDLSQAQRDAVMGRYRKKNLQMLVATDVAARGLDVNEITHVINYNIPDDLETYTHRSGRTGRAGKAGISMAIIGPRDLNKIKQLERILGKTFTKAEVPAGDAVIEKQLMSFIEKVKSTEVEEKQIEPFINNIAAEFEDLSREDLIKKFVSLEFNKFLDYYKNSADLNQNAKAGRDRDSDRGGDRSDRRRKGGDFTKLFLNIGEKDNLNAGTLLGWINGLQSVPNGIEFGKIDVQRSFTFMEVESQHEQTVLGALNVSEFDGRKVVAEPKTGGGPRTSNRSDKSDRPDKKRGSGFKKRPASGGDRKSGGRARVKAGSGGGRRR
ncbi:ATP-dependent RNA helicase DeaD [Marivirga sericea]|uniref:DEAD-box ATP-dependent RNA helicase RhpA n=1 Tax=Marivirga sericea TaxID=1028 RepID=A0A1X7IRL3_9BACT|nr:DEAD/DEAH box helicase [Marivirga sericea]SMG17785.1 ATP-dependent RNA helicase DeaD [Marivirga sericea]